MARGMLFNALECLLLSYSKAGAGEDLQSQTGKTSRVPLSLMEDDREGDEEHVQQPIKHGHV